MKAVALFALLAPFGANAHYIFNRLIVNAASIGGEYAYVRKNSNSYNPSFPSELMNSNDLRCNKGAKASNTATYTVKAGDKLGFKIFNNEFVEYPLCLYLQGHKRRELLRRLRRLGQGYEDWAHPYESWRRYCMGLLAEGSPEWTLVKNIPAGEYLVRVKHIGLHEEHVGKAQFYIECYQLKIESSGTLKPGPTVKIQGVYKASDLGIAFKKWNNPRSYTMPGPAVWDGN
ncbi:hypothetical protein J1614_000843 [Plenodomus biglobosus]|nr:hypothetical protein J1614_000843 [Plenodomus biglobosus]